MSISDKESNKTTRIKITILIQQFALLIESGYSIKDQNMKNTLKTIKRKFFKPHFDWYIKLILQYFMISLYYKRSQHFEKRR